MIFTIWNIDGLVMALIALDIDFQQQRHGHKIILSRVQADDHDTALKLYEDAGNPRLRCN